MTPRNVTFQSIPVFNLHLEFAWCVHSLYAYNYLIKEERASVDAEPLLWRVTVHSVYAPVHSDRAQGRGGPLHLKHQ